MTVTDLLANYYQGQLADAVLWPPDAFALASLALKRSGAYTMVVRQWPPSDYAKRPAEWAKFIGEVGRDWRVHAAKGRKSTTVSKWWDCVLSANSVELRDLCKECNRELCHILIQIVAAADEACEGIGLVTRDGDGFDIAVLHLLLEQMTGPEGRISTVTKHIDNSRLCILPKLHTPKTGITIRSLSHHLALCESGEVTPEWTISPQTLKIAESLNLLLVPWPKTIRPRSFSVVRPTGGPLFNMPEHFGFFNLDIRQSEAWRGDAFRRLLEAARNECSRIDGVILPEAALARGEELLAWQEMRNILPDSFLITGVGGAPRGQNLGENTAFCKLPWGSELDSMVEQRKHHRWLINAAQVEQYGLAGQLSPDINWWEAAEIGERSIKFLRLSPWLVICFLVCEDLARQDPIADVIRAVGPNLVIALLMDGPQLTNRWSCRYATVLADDPGSSVLSLTSLGMARLSRCLGRPESRVVALWKDARRGPFELELPADCEGLILSLRLRLETEWTADGRCSPESAGCWELQSVQPVATT